MPNTKPTGVAYADPQFETVNVSGTTAMGAVTATTVSATSVAASGAVTAASVTTSGNAIAANAVGGVYIYSTAITANSTTTTAPKGSLGLTSNDTGVGKLFYSDGSKWQLATATAA